MDFGSLQTQAASLFNNWGAALFTWHNLLEGGKYMLGALIGQLPHIWKHFFGALGRDIEAIKHIHSKYEWIISKYQNTLSDTISLDFPNSWTLDRKQELEDRELASLNFILFDTTKLFIEAVLRNRNPDNYFQLSEESLLEVDGYRSKMLDAYDNLVRTSNIKFDRKI